ncbi:MAG: outer membrane lipoprotein-sorting protein [Acidobacteria bacterium]|nr:outer membrane lipoprotein-sorting protein [Acidobacteriota bacterium]
MRRWVLVALSAVLGCDPIIGTNRGAEAARQGSPTPEQVARLVQDRGTGRDWRAELRMRLYDRQGRVRERTLTVSMLRGGTAGDKTLVRFLSPNDIKNTALLVWEHPDADDERFLYLPALGRVRRIGGAERQESFAGSDLSYEDIGGRDMADYTYAFADENATWVAPDGTRHPAWALESRARDRGAEFPRSVGLVLKDRFVLAHADIYNQRDERAKVFDVRRLERIDGIWTVLDLVVVNEQQKTRTELTTTSIRYNVGLTDEDFTRRALERPSTTLGAGPR